MKNLTQCCTFCCFEPTAPSVEDLNTSCYLCLTLLNSFGKLDVEFGEILWKTFMLPDNNGDTGGYAGAAVWGSSPSIDIHRNHDFGEAPMMLSIQVEGLKKDIVVAVQKSGFAWAMDRDNGSHVLTTEVGHGGMEEEETGENFILKQSNRPPPLVGGWQWMLEVAKLCGPSLIQTRPLPSAL
ncbi:hypothetical protein ACOSQ2_017596 [Xanthoceras sorbifolium]